MHIDENKAINSFLFNFRINKKRVSLLFWDTLKRFFMPLSAKSFLYCRNGLLVVFGYGRQISFCFVQLLRSEQFSDLRA